MIPGRAKVPLELCGLRLELDALHAKLHLVAQVVLCLEDESGVLAEVDLLKVLDEILLQVLRITSFRKELLMFLEYLLDGGSLGGVLLEAVLDEVHEALVELPRGGQGGRRVVDNRQYHLHRRQLAIGCVSLGELNGGDADGPDVSGVVVARLLHDLGSHPAGRPHEGLPLLTPLQRCRHPEVGYEHMTVHVQEYISRLDVPVDLLILMEVLQAIQGLLEDSRDDGFVPDAVRVVQPQHIQT